MINEKNIEKTISTVIKAAETIVGNMEEGSRLTTKEFVDQIAAETEVPNNVAVGLTSLIVKNCDEIEQRAGRSGGIFKKANSDYKMKIAEKMNEEEENDNA